MGTYMSARSGSFGSISGLFLGGAISFKMINKHGTKIKVITVANKMPNAKEIAIGSIS